MYLADYHHSKQQLKIPKKSKNQVKLKMVFRNKEDIQEHQVSHQKMLYTKTSQQSSTASRPNKEEMEIKVDVNSEVMIKRNNKMIKQRNVLNDPETKDTKYNTNNQYNTYDSSNLIRVWLKNRKIVII